MSSIAFVDTKAHPTADKFYRLFPNEPIPGKGNFAHIGKIVPLGDMSVEALLKGIIKNVKKNGSILTVSHGTDAGLSISIGASRNKILLESRVLTLLESNREGETSDAEAARRLKLSESAFSALKRDIDAVRKLELKRVDVRACNTGSNEFTMSRLRKFFNCHKLSAPKILDVFGPVPFGKISADERVWKSWLTKHKGAKIFGTKPNRFAIDYKVEVAVALSVLAESQQAINDWVAAHLPKGNYKKGPLFYHGFTNAASIVFAGEPGYRDKLAEAVKGKEPSRKIDLNDLGL